MDQFKLMDSSMFFVFRLSQKIEPGTSTPRANASKEDLVGKLGVNCGIIIITTCLINLIFSFFYPQARKRQHLLSVVVNVR